MNSKKKQILILVVLLAVALQLSAQFQGKTCYYLIISNEHYSIEFQKFQRGFSGLTNLEEASVSANYMQQYFKEWGISKGIVLKSTDQKKVNAKAISIAINNLIKLIEKDKSKKNAAVFFYYAGHGFSSKTLQALYLPGGDFTRNPDSLSMDDWNKYSTVALSIHEQFQKHHLPHLMLFDCCYSGRQDSVRRLNAAQIEAFGLKAVDKLMGEMSNIFTAMFKMVGTDPVIFSTRAGGYVHTVPVNDKEDSIYVAPLCRRIGLMRALDTKSPVSDTKAWMKKILDLQFDPLTSSAVSYWEID